MQKHLGIAPALGPLFAAGVATAQPLPSADREPVGMSAERLDRIGTVLQQAIDERVLPGAVIMAARDGKLVCSKGLGMHAPYAGTPMSEDSVFRICSMIRPLVSVAAIAAGSSISSSTRRSPTAPR